MIQKHLLHDQANSLDWLETADSTAQLADISSGSKNQSVADWLKNRPWSSKKNEIAPLFWLLNSMTFDLKAAESIEGWHHRLGRIRTSKVKRKKANEKGFLNRWGDLLEAFQLETLDDAMPESLVSQTLRCLGAAYILPKALKFENIQIVEPILASLIPAISQIRIHDSKSTIQPWLEQLVAVELPLQLNRHFPNLLVDEDTREVAGAWMSNSINEGLDSDGCPSAELMPLFGPMVASWVRSGELLEKLKWSLKPSTSEILSGAVLHLLRMLRQDRQLFFSGMDSAQLTDRGLKRMIKQFGNHVPRRLLHRLQDNPESILARHTDQLPGSPSAWGRSAILRANWKANSAHAVMAFSDVACQCEIGASETLISGTSQPSIKVDGQPVDAVEAFSIACEEFDKDVNYIELTMRLDQDHRLTRQLLLARQEQILFVADSFSAPRAGLIEYSCDWPMTQAISALRETETREIYLQTRAIQALVLPVSLPEWLVGPTTGQLTYQAENHALRLTERINGAGLNVPLVFDLNPKRAREKRTWRQLTVAELGQPVPRDVAAAYRFQIGKEQWYTYRALQSKGFRSFFGEHFAGEFVFGRFNRKGDMEELLRIE